MLHFLLTLGWFSLQSGGVELIHLV